MKNKCEEMDIVYLEQNEEHSEVWGIIKNENRNKVKFLGGFKDPKEALKIAHLELKIGGELIKKIICSS